MDGYKKAMFFAQKKAAEKRYMPLGIIRIYTVRVDTHLRSAFLDLFHVSKGFVGYVNAERRAIERQRLPFSPDEGGNVFSGKRTGVEPAWRWQVTHRGAN